MGEMKINGGVSGQVTLTNKRVIISRSGGLGFLTHGLSGDKEIPIKNITAVQFKPASGLTNGYIQFSILGGNENTGGILSATQDENTIMFSKSAESNFREIKRFIDSIIDEEPIGLDSLNISEVPKSKSGKVLKGCGILTLGFIALWVLGIVGAIIFA
tara:strand:- start:36 stop:509 length:474 start_codon:yes stop_codon:yes gene_type:complete